MAQPLYATRGWKKLQQEYIADNLYALRRKKLDDLLTQSITGLSCEEMTLHYTSLSFLAMHCALCAYMQDGSLSQAEHWLCLSAQARGIVNTILPRNPRWEPAPVKALPMEDLTAALLCAPRPYPSSSSSRPPLPHSHLLLSNEKVTGENPNTPAAESPLWHLAARGGGLLGSTWWILRRSTFGAAWLLRR